MFLGETWYYWIFWAPLVLFLALAPPAAADPALEQWNQGLALIDEDRTDTAADYFYPLLMQQPHRLDLLDGCFRVESRRSHADSVQFIIEQRLQHHLATGSVGRRFLIAKALRQQNEFIAAADSFLELAHTCQAEKDFLSAMTATQMACRSWFDSKDSSLVRQAQEEILQCSRLVEHHPRLDVDIQLIIANAHFFLDELDLAEPLYQSTLQTAQSQGYRELQMDILNALGSLMSKQRRQSEALAYYQQAHATAVELGDASRLCLVLTNLGYQETHQHHLDLARDHLLQAKELADDWGFHKFLGPVQSGLGAVAEMSGDRREAVRRFRAAMTLSEQADNIFVELGSRQRLAYNLAMMGQYTEAQMHFEICLDILDRSGGKFILNWVLAGLAITNHKLGYLDRADELYQRAHAVNIDMGDRMSAAWCLNSLGLIQGLRGDYRQALITHHQAWKQYTELGDQEGAGYALASSAEVYYQLGDYQESLEHCKTVIAVAEEINADELLRKASQTMALIYSATGQSDLAELNFLRVIDICRQWDELVVEIWALNGLAEHYLTQNRQKDAQGCLQSALDLMENQEYFHVRSETCRLLGRASASPAEALPWAEQALKLAETGGLPDLEWKALSDLGLYHTQLNQLQQAEKFLQRSVTLVESLRRQAGSDELRRHMLIPALQPYERLVELYTDHLHDPASAFVTTERSRAQILANRLHAALAHGHKQPVRATDPQERGLTATITFLQSQLQEANLSKTVRDSLRQQVSALENEFSLLKLQWSVEDEMEATVLFPEAPEAEQLMAVLKPNEHLLSYFLGTHQSFLFSLSPTEIKTYVLPARHILEDRIKLFLSLQKHATDEENSLPPEVLMTAREELYSLLVQPAAGDFDASSTLVIAPDGLLHRLPFAFLHDGQQYLFENNELFTVPSLQTLSFLRQRTQDSTLDESSKTILAIGCAGRENEGPDNEERLHPFTDAPVPSLPLADEEVWQLASLFDQTQILTGSGANEEKIRSGILASADIIHIAAHSYADEVDARRSYILLNRPAEPHADDTPSLFDGLLLWHEIVDLELNASLVTLASCRSAGGMLTSGEGITGLTQAFLLAGSRCVLASQTDVPDWETAWFMDHFYRELRAGSTAAAALRTVRLLALQDHGDRHGIFPGGGFILTGDATMTYAEKPSRTLAGALVIGLLTLAVLVFRRQQRR